MLNIVKITLKYNININIVNPFNNYYIMMYHHHHRQYRGCLLKSIFSLLLPITIYIELDYITGQYLAPTDNFEVLCKCILFRSALKWYFCCIHLNKVFVWQICTTFDFYYSQLICTLLWGNVFKCIVNPYLHCVSKTLRFSCSFVPSKFECYVDSVRL